MTERVDYFTSNGTLTKQINVIISDEFGLVKIEDDNGGDTIIISIIAATRLAEFIKVGK